MRAGQWFMRRCSAHTNYAPDRCRWCPLRWRGRRERWSSHKAGEKAQREFVGAHFAQRSQRGLKLDQVERARALVDLHGVAPAQADRRAPPAFQIREIARRPQAGQSGSRAGWSICRMPPPSHTSIVVMRARTAPMRPARIFSASADCSDGDGRGDRWRSARRRFRRWAARRRADRDRRSAGTRSCPESPAW